MALEQTPQDPLAFDFGLGFKTAPERIVGERESRIARGQRALKYHHALLDDQLRALAPHDLVLLGAESGAGKTQIATTIAQALAKQGKHVHFFALEAEENEIERRIKYALVRAHAEAKQVSNRDDLSYPDWMLGRCDAIVGELEDAADREFALDYSTLHTYYRGARFGHDEIRKLFLAIQSQADLIILDHLHYVDIDDDNENRGFKRTMKLIRDISLAIGTPIILVAHLRKRDVKNPRLVPSADDFHGSSDILKICTRAVLLAPSWNKSHVQKWHSSPTFVHVVKDRVGGRQPFVAICQFDRRSHQYWPTYTLGRVSGDGTKWTQLDTGPGGQDHKPRWAEHHARMNDET